MVYENLSEEEKQAKLAEMDAKSLASSALRVSGSLDDALIEKLSLVAEKRLAEERLPLTELATFSEFIIAYGNVMMEIASPQDYKYLLQAAIATGFQIGHDYFAEYGQLLTDDVVPVKNEPQS